jgi:DNA-binding transcriptional regulator LsrR (DeoR family)
LQSTHIPSLGGNPELTEASCDECMMLARRTFKAQFPSLYTPRWLSENECKQCFERRLCLRIVIQKTNILAIIPLGTARVAS